MALYESGGVQGYVYFPTSSIVSLLYVLADGSSAEIAVTGCEGLVGIALFMGGEARRAAQWWKAPARATGSGSGAEKEVRGGGRAATLLLRFTQALITQMTQTAVCNRHHAVDQQLCRWLLLSLDRLPANLRVRASLLGTGRRSSRSRQGSLNDHVWNRRTDAG